MTFASVIRNLEKSPLTAELIQKLEKNGNLTLTGLAATERINKHSFRPLSRKKSCNYLCQSRRSGTLGGTIRSDDVERCFLLSHLGSLPLRDI
jgi:hypothetical protein